MYSASIPRVNDEPEEAGVVTGADLFKKYK